MTVKEVARASVPALLVGAALLAAGCSSSSTPSASAGGSAPPTSVAAPGASVPFNQTDNARADVATSVCTDTAQGWALHGTVKNSAAVTKTFQIVVDFLSQPGSTVLATTVLTIGGVPPGRVRAWTALGAKGRSDVACVVRLAQST